MHMSKDSWKARIEFAVRQNIGRSPHRWGRQRQHRLAEKGVNEPNLVLGLTHCTNRPWVRERSLQGKCCFPSAQRRWIMSRVVCWVICVCQARIYVDGRRAFFCATCNPRQIFQNWQSSFRLWRYLLSWLGIIFVAIRYTVNHTAWAHNCLTVNA